MHLMYEGKDHMSCVMCANVEAWQGSAFLKQCLVSQYVAVHSLVGDTFFDGVYHFQLSTYKNQLAFSSFIQISESIQLVLNTKVFLVDDTQPHVTLKSKQKYLPQNNGHNICTIPIQHIRYHSKSNIIIVIPIWKVILKKITYYSVVSLNSHNFSHPKIR